MKNDILYNSDTCFYILIHELAHVLYQKKGHDLEFKKIENSMLDIALKYKILDSKKINYMYGRI